jgi:pyruvate/2-oxoglutarate dehydrogenase complex dihydrolipoamide dehydrogenase (E3) component
MRSGEKFGIGKVEPEIDFKAVMRHVRKVIAGIAPTDSVERFSALGVTVIKAEARFTSRSTLVAGDTEIRARRYVLATGSSPFVPAIPGLDGIGYLTNETVFELNRRPGHLIIIGGGPVGLELAQAFQRLGSQVTVIEAATVLARDDPEMVSVVVRKLRSEGVIIHEHTKVTGVERRGKTSVKVLVDTPTGPDEIDGSHLLIAAGRIPNTEGLDLKKARVALDGKVVDVSAMLRTTNRRIYAVGDVTGAPQFTHMANYHAGLVLRALLFRLPAKDRAIVPYAIFTDPELAHVGLTEAQAVKRYRGVRILRWPYAENDRAQAERKTEGHIKLVAGRKGNILGVTIAGANASEMIGIWALALSQGLGLKDMASTIPPYPTMGEIGKRAAITYFAAKARKPLVRGLARFLQLFG